MTTQGVALLSAIDPEYTRDLVPALMPETDPVMVRLFHRPERDLVTTVSGLQMYMPIDQAAPSEAKDTRVAFDAGPNSTDIKTERSEWQFKGKYSEEATIHLIDLQGLGNNPDQVHEAHIRKMLGQLAYKIDAHGFSSVLNETSTNQTLDVKAGSRPNWKDNDAPIMTILEEAMDLTKGAGDILVIGDEIARVMRRNKLFRDRDARIVAADGFVNNTRMAQIISSELDIDVVILNKRWFKTNAKGAPVTYSNLFSQNIGLYSRDHIQAKVLGFAEEFHTGEYNKKTQCVSSFGHRYVNFHRVPESEGGVVFTNMLA